MDPKKGDKNYSDLTKPKGTFSEWIKKRKLRQYIDQRKGDRDRTEPSRNTK